ncbi:FlaD/FlaE family flagellar protein [Halorussus marinus]|uniref:FlaD/FlaE family flagellar protein n=1 Tax=Halorussus marinus TaxID=2505976 RepID=UPI001FCF13D8|nr:FlaD/FlaE family flagellar protein [Halorussus marinus]
MKLLGLGDQFVYLLGTGLVGMGIMDFMDEEEGENADGDGEDDDLFGDGMGEEMDDDFGGMDDGMEMDDDFGGMDDGMEMDDDFGGMDDGMGGGGEEFGMGGGGGGGGAATQELENRIDELENEVAEISSTVGTVRSENEQISAKVDDTEENVRKLLEIYEMVTRGVNPFVDDVQGGGMGGDGFDGAGGGGGSFGLFDGEEETEEEEDLDDDVADAEAESFFEDDFEEEADDEFEDDFEEEADEEFEDDFEADAADDLGFDDPDEGMGDDAFGDGMDMDGGMDMGGDMDDDGDDGGQAGGSTFAELKEEYESGDADWANGEETASEVDTEVEPEPEPDPDLDPEPEPEPTVESEPDDGGFEFEEPADSTDTAETEPVATETRQSGLDSKPYLAELPSGYVADLVVMEWLEFLVTEFGPEDAVRTITYYGDIGWVSESVEEELLAYVGGFADVEEVDPDETGPATLAIDDHIQSLTFLSQLTGDAVQRKIVEHCAQIRGGSDGIQR